MNTANSKQKYQPWLTFFGFILLTVFFFRPTFLKGLLPVHVNLFPTWFFPWSDGGYPAYSAWITHKEFIAADALRQVIPWKKVAFDLVKQGQWPLWNPYEFAGNPLLANFQSSVFYPANIFFLFVKTPIAWTIYIISQTALSLWFSWLFFRSLKMSNWISISGAIFFTFSGNMIVSLEWGTINHTVLWLPLMLWSVNRLLSTGKKRYWFVNLGSLVSSFMAGQIYYFCLIFAAYLVYLVIKLKSSGENIRWIKVYAWLIVVFGLMVAVQLGPTLELNYHSSRNTSSTNREAVEQFFLPPRNLITLISPDFFGNPAAGNFWGREYGEFMIFIGNVALFLALYGWLFVRHPLARYGRILCALGLVIMIKNPIISGVIQLELPLVSSSAPARGTVILSWGLILLAILALDTITYGKKQEWKKTLIVIAIELTAMVLVVFMPTLYPSLFPDMSAINTARRNLVLPFMVIGLVWLIMIAYGRWRRKAIFYLLLPLALIEPYYLANKYLPFGSGRLFFPDHPVISMLQQESGHDRFFGNWGAHIDTNLPSYYHLLYPEGYDSLNINYYSELAYAALYHGELRQDIPRSDVRMPKEDTENKQRLLAVTGTGILLDKQEDFGVNPEIDTKILNSDYYFWQQGAWKAYQNPVVIPRPALFDQYEAITDSSLAVKRFYDPDFDYRQRLILSENIPDIKLDQAEGGNAHIASYQANKIVIDTTNKGANLLFLSDAYYPGWVASVDGVKTKIYRADHAFRAVVVPPGRHTIVFQYRPLSFTMGGIISVVGLFITMIFLGKDDPKQ